MSTYENCYSMVSDIRQAIGDYSEAKVTGEDTLGAYTNDYITKKINESVRELFALIAERAPGLFNAETQLTGVSSVYTLPWDFAKLQYFKDDDGREVYEIGERQRRLNDATGLDRLYRRVGNTLVLDKAGITTTYTLIYRKKPRTIHHGKASDGGALSITLATNAPKIADYFNGMTIENITKDWVGTVSDYTAARVATIAAETAAADDYYGLVPEIPDWAHHLIVPRATLKIRAEHPLTKRKPTVTDYRDYNEDVRRTLVDNLSQSDDQDYDALFTTLDPIY